MGALNIQRIVDPQEYAKRYGVTMSQSLKDAFEDILSKFPEKKIDEKYDSGRNLFLKNGEGDIYYYDDFKYVRPLQTSEESEIRVLNNSRGTDKFCCVIFNGNNSIVVENYDANDTVEISSYFLTDEARSFISSGGIENGINGFLFQVSGGNMGYIERLQFGSKIRVKKEGENLVSYGSDNSIIGMAPINAGGAPGDISFYRAVERNVDYYGLLDDQYSSSNEYGNKSSVKS